MPKAGKQRIQNYGLDFKLRAVQLSNQPGVLVKDVAESLDIHPFMLSRWRKEVRDGVFKGRPRRVDMPLRPRESSSSCRLSSTSTRC